MVCFPSAGRRVFLSKKSIKNEVYRQWDTVKSAPRKSTKSLIIKGLKELSESKEARRKVDESYFKELKGKEHWIVYLLMYALDNMEDEFFRALEELSKEQKVNENELLRAIKEEREALIKVKKSIDAGMENFGKRVERLIEERMDAQRAAIAESVSNLVRESLGEPIEEIKEKVSVMEERINSISSGFSDSYKLLSHNQAQINKLGKRIEEISEDLSALEERIAIEISRIPGAEGAAEAMKELEKSIESIKEISGDVEKIRASLEGLKGLDKIAKFSKVVEGLEKEIEEVKEGLDSLNSVMVERIKEAMESAGASAELEKRIKELGEKVDSINFDKISESLKGLESIGQIASEVEDVRKRLGSFEEMGDFYGEIDDLRKKLENVRKIEDEMKKDMDVLRRIVGEFEEVASLTEMLGELSARVQKVEEFGEKLASLDMEAIKESVESPGKALPPEVIEKIESLGALQEEIEELKPLKEKVSALEPKIADIEKKVDMILKSTNRHLDVIEKNIKAEIAKLKGEDGGKQ